MLLVQQQRFRCPMCRQNPRPRDCRRDNRNGRILQLGLKSILCLQHKATQQTVIKVAHTRHQESSLVILSLVILQHSRAKDPKPTRFIGSGRTSPFRAVWRPCPARRWRRPDCSVEPSCIQEHRDGPNVSSVWPMTSGISRISSRLCTSTFVTTLHGMMAVPTSTAKMMTTSTRASVMADVTLSGTG